MKQRELYIFDCEVFKHDWIFVFKSVADGHYVIIHNDYQKLIEFCLGLKEFIGFNNSRYDDFILKGALLKLTPQQIKKINDDIIKNGLNGYNLPILEKSKWFVSTIDLMQDMQQGLSLKAIQGHLGLSVEECSIDFDYDYPLTYQQLEQVIKYCKHDVDTTEKLYHLRKDYLNNKHLIGELSNMQYNIGRKMTNAKLTAKFLKARRTFRNDERNYSYPTNLLKQYIPSQVFDFFDKLHDKRLSNEEVFSSKLELNIGKCKVTLGYGGIHGAIPTYTETATQGRIIRNVDVASYYPHLMVHEGYCSRSMEDPNKYAELLQERMKAKKDGDTAKANALKLVANTTYGAMLDRFNDLHDPLMGRSVCITGQLRLLELAEHLATEIESLKIIQLNTDGIMVSFYYTDEPKYKAICDEWQQRTKFTLEEDDIKKIVQKDVNNYIEVATNDKVKIKGGQLVRGISTAGAFNINNNAPILAKSIVDYFVTGTRPNTTIHACNDPLQFQLIAKASSLYSYVYHDVEGVPIEVQKCNRVYASKNHWLGTLYKVHKDRRTKAKMAGLPEHSVIDNNNQITIENIDKEWYIKQANKIINSFAGINFIDDNSPKHYQQLAFNFMEVKNGK